MKATVKKPFTPGFMLYDWMAADLRLAMIPRLVFAMVFSFSVIDKDFYGSLNHVADRLGVSRRSAVEAFKELTAGGLLVKRTEVRNGVQYCVYNVAPEVLSKYTESPSEGSAEFAPGSAEFAPGVVQKLHGGSAEIAPNNKKDITSSTYKVDSVIDARVSDPTPEVASSLFPEEEVLTPEEVAPINPKTTRKEKSSAKKEKILAATSPEFQAFQTWIAEHAPDVAKMQQPFTEEQFFSLCKDYDSRAVADVLEAMGNTVGLTKKYKSAALTCRNWLRRRSENQSAPVTSAPRFSRPAPAEPISKVEQNARAGAAAAEMLRRKYEMKTT